MIALRILLGSAAAGVLLAKASTLVVPWRSPDQAELRLSWSARPERIETCRTLSAEELAKEPEHMRQRVECQGKFASYDLRVDLDGRSVTQFRVRGGGFRHDRPMHVLRDLAISPGTHRLALEFTRREAERPEGGAGTPASGASVDTGLFAGRAERENTERERRRRAAIPPRLNLDTTMRFVPGRVVLVTFDPERRAFVVRVPSQGTP